MRTSENIIVSMTSWKKRITNVLPVVKTLMKQTIQPYKIVLNFCIQDFPHTEKDLPQDLLDYVQVNKNKIEIYWFIENYKAWKKHLHVLEIAGDNDLILCTDDDHLYPEDFIEKMYMSYVHYGKEFPVTLNRVMLVHNMWSFNGPGTLYRKRDFGDYKKFLTYDVLHNCAEDTFIQILFAMNRVACMPMIYEFPEDKDLLFNDNDAFTDPQAIARNGKEEIERLRVWNAKSHDVISNSFEINYYNDKELASKRRYRPNQWAIMSEFHDWLIKKYLEPDAALEFCFEKYDSNFLKPNFSNVPERELCLNRKYEKDRFKLIGERRVIVTLSSWDKRISNVAEVLKTLLNQTFSADYIILNLARPDFNIPNDSYPTLDELGDAFPTELINLLSKEKSVRIHWYNDSSLKSWKKYLYVVNHFSSDDIIITADDDFLYKDTFIETLVKSWNFYGRNFPITPNISSMCQGGYGVCGFGMLFCPKYLYDKTIKNSFNEVVNDTIIHMGPEDNHLLNLFMTNWHIPMPVVGYDYLFSSTDFNQGESNFGTMQFDDKFFENLKQISEESDKIIVEKFAHRPGANGGWRPSYFNFAREAVQNYLNEYKEKHKDAGGILEKVYDSYFEKFKINFGQNTQTGMEKYLFNTKI